MSGPYRDPELWSCPACGSSLRPYGKRLCCDACGGIMLTPDDLLRAIHAHTRTRARLRLVVGDDGARRCPRCQAQMAVCHLEATLEGHEPELTPELDRCVEHGVWFDVDELATIFEAARKATEPGGGSLADLVRTIIETKA
jgi:hypothetical protein